MDEDLSTADKLVCKVPPVATVYSNENFGIEKDSHDLDSGIYFGTGKNVSTMFDNDLTVANEDGSSECIIGMAFKEEHVGFLSQVKFFMGDIGSKDPYDGVLAFEGSDDDITYTNLFTVNVNIHEGWNYFYWDDPVKAPKYRYYRFKGERGSCNMHEVMFRGI
mmetsp:Transcript_41647/g.63631  ORF Transcript_41647/g.63631 Transcript_41647/m.63631 type:complete len:163 (-) Transcript_41647:5785-6273(-)